MSESVTEIRPQEREEKLAQLLGWLNHYTWRADAAAGLLRDIADDASQHPDSQYKLLQVQATCETVLIATSYLMDYWCELGNLLEAEGTDWRAIQANLPAGSDMRKRLEQSPE